MALKHDALITSELPPEPRGVLTNERAGRGPGTVWAGAVRLRGYGAAGLR